MSDFVESQMIQSQWRRQGRAMGANVPPKIFCPPHFAPLPHISVEIIEVKDKYLIVINITNKSMFVPGLCLI